MVELAQLLPPPPGSASASAAPSRAASAAVADSEVPPAGGEGDASTKAGSEGSGRAESAAGSGPRLVAVKRLKPDILESEADCISFVTETRLLLRLRNPGAGCLVLPPSDNSACAANAARRHSERS